MSSVALARQGRNSGGAKPVFVDALGTRGRLMRVGVWLFVGLCSAYVAFFIMAALGGPTISTARLPIRVPIVSALCRKRRRGDRTTRSRAGSATSNRALRTWPGSLGPCRDVRDPWSR